MSDGTISVFFRKVKYRKQNKRSWPDRSALRCREDKAKDRWSRAFVTRLTGVFTMFRKYCIAQTFVLGEKFFLFAFNLLTAFETLP
ncbi:hypothetical protein GLE_3655 [Lysobacter enzymogenes]|uniref:Uncharacterized protein n=1 Tax=Lysobacter enzymogenes TaxID=69 RepID=A0A0S2DKC7_LYSEN|nr:hypothetical protein GLE_3655 [Lysobacter enzymogenes]